MPSLNRFYLAYLLKSSKYTRKFVKKSPMGFTLLELLITVIIIGILAAIAIPSYVATVDKFHYGKAKIQMGCLKRELEGYRFEKGNFPIDGTPNQVPVGIECFLQQNTKQVPYNSRYDYDQWILGSTCIVQIIFFGKDNQRQASVRTLDYQEIGFHESNRLANDDDLVLSLGLHDPSVCPQR